MGTVDQCSLWGRKRSDALVAERWARKSQSSAMNHDRRASQRYQPKAATVTTRSTPRAGRSARRLALASVMRSPSGWGSDDAAEPYQRGPPDPFDADERAGLRRVE